jgi:hypothetical protein
MLQCEPLAAAAGAPCIEGSDATGVEGCAKQGSVGGWCGVGPACACSRRWRGRSDVQGLIRLLLIR